MLPALVLAALPVGVPPDPAAIYGGETVETCAWPSVVAVGGACTGTLIHPEIDKMIDQQSMQTDPEKRKQLTWDIERKLAETAVRPVLFFPVGYSCWQPWVKNLNIMANSIYNGWRMEDVWLDKKS